MAESLIGAAKHNPAEISARRREAVDWARKSASQGFPAAERWLGEAYATSSELDDYGGLERNEETAFSWFQKAAIHGDAQAQYRLGGMLREGRGCAKDLQNGLEWYKKAAAQGHVEAREALWRTKADAERQKAGPRPGDEDLANARAADKAGRIEEAWKYYLSSANAGNVEAQLEYGRSQIFAGCVELIQQESTDVKKQPRIKQGYIWIRKAAEQGDAEAEFELGQELVAGQYLDADPKQGREWLEKSAAQGYPKAQDALRKLKSDAK